MMQTIQLILSIVYTTITLAVLIIKPIREKLFNLKSLDQGVQCLLRSQMLEIYFGHQDKKELKEYERKNFDKLYDAYITLGGNSFIHDIYEEIREWDVKR